MRVIDKIVFCISVFFLLLVAVPAIAIRISELALVILFLILEPEMVMMQNTFVKNLTVKKYTPLTLIH